VQKLAPLCFILPKRGLKKTPKRVKIKMALLRDLSPRIWDIKKTREPYIVLLPSWSKVAGTHLDFARAL
jgi:hypothetical protein